MGIFKSKEERRIERDLEIKKGISKIKRQIKSLEKHEKNWLSKARRAKDIGAKDQLEFMKKSLKATASQKRMLERQLLTIEAARQMKDQAESHGQFAKSMHAVSKAIGDVYKSVDITKTTKDFEIAIARADSISERVDLFLEMSAESMFGYEGDSEDLVTDEEIEMLINDDTVASEGSRFDGEIAEGLKEIKKELGKGGR